MALSLGTHSVLVTRYLHGEVVDHYEVDLAVKKYKDGKTIVRYGPVQEVQLINDRYHLRIDMVDFSNVDLSKTGIKLTKS